MNENDSSKNIPFTMHRIEKIGMIFLIVFSVFVFTIAYRYDQGISRP